MIDSKQSYTGYKKTAYKQCDRNNPYFNTVIQANKEDMRILCEQFEVFARQKLGSVNGAINELREKGIIISKNGLNRFKRGLNEKASLSYVNILTTFMGYSGICDMFKSLAAKGDCIAPESK